MIAAGLFKLRAAGPRVAFETGASFQPPFSGRLGGGAGGPPVAGVPFAPLGGGAIGADCVC